MDPWVVDRNKACPGQPEDRQWLHLASPITALVPTGRLGASCLASCGCCMSGCMSGAVVARADRWRFLFGYGNRCLKGLLHTYARVDAKTLQDVSFRVPYVFGHRWCAQSKHRRMDPPLWCHTSRTNTGTASLACCQAQRTNPPRCNVSAAMFVVCQTQINCNRNTTKHCGTQIPRTCLRLVHLTTHLRATFDTRRSSCTSTFCSSPQQLLACL